MLFSGGGGGMSSKFYPHSCIKSTHIKILCKEDEKTMNLKRKTLIAGGGLAAVYLSTLCGTTLRPFGIFLRFSKTLSSVSSLIETI
jgi:hypothetical protein